GAGAAGLPPPAARGPSPDPPGRPPPPPGTPPDVPPPGAPPPGAPPPPGVPPPDVPSSRVASTRTRTPSVWYTASSTALACRALEKVRASPGAANPSFSVPFSRATTCAFGPTRDHVTRATARAPSTSCQRRRTVSVVTPGSMPSAGAASAAAGASDGTGAGAAGSDTAGSDTAGSGTAGSGGAASSGVAAPPPGCAVCAPGPLPAGSAPDASSG